MATHNLALCKSYENCSKVFLSINNFDVAGFVFIKQRPATFSFFKKKNNGF